MKISPVTPSDLASSVLAVPPLARHRDLTISTADNRALIQYLEEGGVRTLLYGGNANLYNVGAGELPELLDMLEEEAGEDTWVIPSVGPDYGKLIDALPVLKGRAFHPLERKRERRAPGTGQGEGHEPDRTRDGQQHAQRALLAFGRGLHAHRPSSARASAS